jgi:hypothetical protein
MKTLVFLLVSTLSPFAAYAQGLPVKINPPKRPLGVPADASHFKGRWYKVILQKKSWSAARDKCKDMGGRLACIPDAATWEFVRALTPATVWLGATDEATEGVWKWLDGTPVAVQPAPWYQSQPDNALGAEHFLSTYKGQWNDAPKSGEFNPGQFVVGFICEW